MDARGEIAMSRDDQVKVTLLLGGGHRETVALARQEPLLRQLIAALQAKGRGELPTFNVRIEEGRQSLVFSAMDLAGIITDPPIAFEAPQAPAQVPPIVKSRYKLFENFLSPDEHKALLELVAREQNRFVDSSVSTNDADYRRSKVLHDIPEVQKLFREKLTPAAPRLMQDLGIAPFQVGDVEVQLTAHGDGNYFKLHNDSGSPDTATRGLTYVYYFFNEPKRFSGGALRMYDSVIKNNQYHCGPHAADIEPTNNSIIFFAPHLHHEVLPVRVPSDEFRDYRFTVNGWLRRAA
jgi:SM-20-related protein